MECRVSREKDIEEAMIGVLEDSGVTAYRWCDNSEVKSASSVFVRCEPPEPCTRDAQGKPDSWKARVNVTARSLVDQDADTDELDAEHSEIEEAMDGLSAGDLNTELSGTGITVDGVMRAQGESGMDKVDDVEWHLRMSSSDLFFQYVKPEEDPTT
jgi:hypothetical protein